MEHPQLIQIPPQNNVKVPKPEPLQIADEGTVWHSTAAFQETVLDPDVTPEELQQAIQLQNAVVARAGEDVTRRIAAAKENSESEAFIKETIGRVDAARAADQILSLPYHDTALENLSLDNHTNTALGSEDALGPLEAVDTAVEYQKKWAHVSRDMEKLLKTIENQGIGEKIAEFGGAMLGWNAMRSRVGLGGDSTPNYLNPLQANQVFDEVYSIMHNTRTYDEFIPVYNEYLKNLKERSGIFGVNDALVLKGLDRLLKFNDPSAIALTNIESTLDYADMGLGAVGMMKALKLPAGIARITGNPNLAAKLTFNHGSGTTTLQGTPNAVHAAHQSLTGVNQMPTAGIPNLTISNNIQQVQKGITSYIDNHFDEISKYRSPDQLAQIKTLSEDVLRTRYPNRVIDVRWQKVDQTGEEQFTEFMDVYVGTDQGTGFSTDAWARSYAQAVGIQNYDVVQDIATRRWLIKTQHRPTESTNLLQYNLDEYSDSWTKRVLSGARQRVSGREISTGALAELRQGALTEQFKPLIKTVEKLSSKEKNNFNVITTKGLTTGSGKWFNDNELVAEYNLAFNRNPTRKEVDAYHAFRAISDTEWYIRNRALRETLAFDGWKEIEVGSAKSLGRTIDSVPNGAKVYDVNGNLITPGPGDTIVKLMDAATNPQGGFPIAYVKVDNIMSLKELPSRVLGYAEGGRRFYDADYYIKQARNIVTPDGVHVFNPRTGTATKTAKEANEVASAMNDANRIYAEWSQGLLTNAAADAQLGMHRTLSALDIQRIDQMVNAKQWDVSQVWEAVPDRGMPKATKEALSSNNSINYTSQIDDTVLFADRVGSMYYSQRGDTLKSFETGQPLPAVNVFESMSRGVSSAVRTGAWNKYRIEAVNSWVNTAKDFNAIENVDILRSNPFEILRSAVVKSSDPAVQRKLETARNQILWNIDPATYDSHRLDSLHRGLREWLYDRDGIIKNYPKLTDFIENRIMRNPVASLRGLTFDRHVGMFGLDQVFVQSNTLMSAAATYGHRAATDAMPYTLALRMVDATRGFKNTRSFNDFMNTVASKFPGIDKTELQRRHKAMESIGVMNVGGEYADLQQMGAYVESSRVLGAIDKFRSKGRMFFNWAEQNNRLVAFNIAYDMAKKEGLDPLSQRGLDFLALKTQDFSFNMTRSQTASWQRGFPSLFTQFFGYTGRYIDALYGKQFTGMQKAKFALSNFILFGATGLPFGNSLAEYMGMDPTEMGGVLDEVLLGFILGEDTETAFRSRVSPAQQVEELARSILMDGASSVFATPAGDTVLDLFNLFRPAGKVWNLRYAFQSPNPVYALTTDGIDAITDFVTPWNRAERAWLVYQTQRIESRYSRMQTHTSL
jgi:hypothetical protein